MSTELVNVLKSRAQAGSLFPIEREQKFHKEVAKIELAVSVITDDIFTFIFLCCCQVNFLFHCLLYLWFLFVISLMKMIELQIYTFPHNCKKEIFKFVEI